MADIRIDVSFLNHRKRKRLTQLLGPGATDYLIDLWITTSMTRPKGILHGMDEIDIALDANFPGDAHEFCRIMCEVRFLDHMDDGTYVIHDWLKHQPFVYYGDIRSERARNSVRKRYELQAEYKHPTKRIRPVKKTYTPNPSPIPSPTPKNPPLTPPKDQNECVSTNGHKTLMERFEDFWSIYPKKRSKGQAEKAWLIIKPGEQLLATMVATIGRAKTSVEWQRDGGKYIPYPATWLNAKGWADVIQPETGPSVRRDDRQPARVQMNSGMVSLADVLNTTLEKMDE